MPMPWRFRCQCSGDWNSDWHEPPQAHLESKRSSSPMLDMRAATPFLRLVAERSAIRFRPRAVQVIVAGSPDEIAQMCGEAKVVVALAGEGRGGGVDVGCPGEWKGPWFVLITLTHTQMALCGKNWVEKNDSNNENQLIHCLPSNIPRQERQLQERLGIWTPFYCPGSLHSSQASQSLSVHLYLVPYQGQLYSLVRI